MTQFLEPDEDGVLVPHPTGLVEMTNEQYHGSKGISKSHLDAINRGDRHYWHRYLNPDREPEEQSPALIMGSAIHSAVLEPDLFPSEYVMAPTSINKRTNEGKAAYAAFEAANKGKTVLSPEDYATCLAVRDAVHMHPVASGLLHNGHAEQSFFAVDPETGELIKCRTDYMHDSGGMIVDLKTTEDASPAGFGKSAANFRYPVQTAWYNDVLDACFGEHPEVWTFLAVEKKPPYCVGIYFTEYDQVARARIAARRDLQRILDCRARGQWLDYGHTPQPLLLPAWCKF